MANHPNRSGDVARIADLIARRRAIGWRMLRLNINQDVGAPTVARIGWRASDLGLEASTTLMPPQGVTAYEWQAPDDDIVPLKGAWSDTLMRDLCRRVGSSGFERQTTADGSHVSWLADIPRNTVN